MGAAAKDILTRVGDAVQNAADDILMPVYERIDKNSMTDEEKFKARRDDPKFREQDDKFQERVRERQRRKAKEKGEEYP